MRSNLPTHIYPKGKLRSLYSSLIILLIVLSLMFTLVSCAKSPDQEIQETAKPAIQDPGQIVDLSDKQVGNYFKTTKAEMFNLKLPEDAKYIFLNNQLVLDSKIVLISSVDCGPEMPAEEGEKIWNEYYSQCSMMSIMHLYKETGELLAEIDLEQYIGKNADVLAIAKASSTSLYCLVDPAYMYGDESNQSSTLYKMDLDGQSISKCEKIKNFDQSFWRMYADSKSNIFLADKEAVYMYNDQGELLKEIKFEAGIWMNTAFIYQDQLYLEISKSDESGKNPPENWIVRVNWEQGDFESVLNQAGYDYNTTVGEDIYVDTSAGISRLNLEDGSLTPFMRWQDTDYIPEQGSEGDRTYVISKDLVVQADIKSTIGEKPSVSLSFLHRQDKNPNEGKQIITLSGRNIEMDQTLSGAVKKFNQAQDQYMVRVLTENKQDEMDPDFENYLQQMTAEFLAGNSSDMMVVSSYEFPMYLQGNILLDLKKVFADDQEFQNIDILPNVLQIGKVGDRTLGLPLNFYLSGAVIPQSELPQNSHSFSLKDFNNLVAKYPNFKSKYMQDQMQMLYQFLPFCLDNFIDETNNTVDFNNPLLEELLAFVKQYGLTPEEYNVQASGVGEPITGNRYKSKELAFDYVMGWLSPATFAAYETAYDEPVTVVGYPSPKGAAPLLNSDSILVVNEATSNQEGIKAFIKFYLSDEAQLAYTESTEAYQAYLPIRSSSLDKTLLNAQDPVKPELWGWSQVNLPDMDPQAPIKLTAEGAKRFKVAIDAAEANYPYDQGLYDIIVQEAQPFFVGDKTAQQVAELIQNRAQVALGERG